MINLRRPIAILLSVMLAFAPYSAAQAGMIGNEQILNRDFTHQDRVELKRQIENDTVREHLQAWGITPDQAKSRIDSLTDEEVARIYRQLDDPQVGSGVVGILLAVILVFVITDIIGATDIFPFINPAR